MMTSFVLCGSCKQKIDTWKLTETIQKAQNGMIQIRGECPYCRTWIKWIPYRDSETVKHILRAFFEGSLESLIALRNTAIYDEKEKDIR